MKFYTNRNTLSSTAMFFIFSSVLTTCYPVTAWGSESTQEQKFVERKIVEPLLKLNPLTLLEGNFKQDKSINLQEKYTSTFLNEYNQKSIESQQKSIPIFEDLAQNGLVGAMFFLGTHYKNQSDEEAAFCWYMAAFLTNYRNEASNEKILSSVKKLEKFRLADFFYDAMTAIPKHEFITKRLFDTVPAFLFYASMTISLEGSFKSTTFSHFSLTKSDRNAIKSFRSLFLPMEKAFKKNFSEYYFTIFQNELFKQIYKGKESLKDAQYKTFQDWILEDKASGYIKLIENNQNLSVSEKGRLVTTARLYLEKWDTEAAYSALSTLYVNHIHNFEIAQKYIEECIKRNPTKKSYSNLGYLYSDGYVGINLPLKNRIEKAEQYFQSSLKMDQNFDFALYGLGTTRYILKDYKNALKFLEKANSPKAKALMGEIWYEKAIEAHLRNDSSKLNAEKSILYLKEALEKGKDKSEYFIFKSKIILKNIMMLLNLGNKLTKEDREDFKEKGDESNFSLKESLEKIDVYEKNDFCRIETAKFYFFKAKSYFMKKEFDHSHQYIEKSLRIVPLYTAFHAMGTLSALGHIGKHLKKEECEDRALPYFLEAYSRCSADSTVLASLGETYFHLGDYEKAKFYSLKAWTDHSLYLLGRMNLPDPEKNDLKDLLEQSKKALMYLQRSKSPKASALIGEIYYNLAINSRDKISASEVQSYLNQSITSLNKALCLGASESEYFISQTTELLQKVIQLSEVEEKGVEEDSEETGTERNNAPLEQNIAKLEKDEKEELTPEVKPKPIKEKKISKREKKLIEKEISMMLLQQRRENKSFEFDMGEKKGDMEVIFISNEVKNEFEKITSLKGTAFKKISAIFEDTEFNTKEGSIGRLEALKGDLKGWFSLRVTKKDRLVYTVLDGKMLIGSCSGHYNNENALINALKKIKQQQKEKNLH